MNTKAAVVKRVNKDSLKALLEVLPRGKANHKSGKELIEALEGRGVFLSLRQIQAAVETLIFDHGAVIGSESGNGYYMITTQQEFKDSRGYILTLLDRHRRRANKLTQNWYNQPLKRGQPLDLIEFSFQPQSTEPEKCSPGYIEIAKSERAASLSYEQGEKAIELYWRYGLNFQRVAERLTEGSVERISKDRVEYFWNKLGLPRRVRGGWGPKHDEAKVEACMRRLKAYFQRNGKGEDED